MAAASKGAILLSSIAGPYTPVSHGGDILALSLPK